MTIKTHTRRISVMALQLGKAYCQKNRGATFQSSSSVQVQYTQFKFKFNIRDTQFTQFKFKFLFSSFLQIQFTFKFIQIKVNT